MSIQKYIKENLELLGSNTYTAPSIPDKKLDGAIKSYAQDVELEYVIALKDSSILLNGREGCLFLGDAVYMKASFGKALKLDYEMIGKVDYRTTETVNRLGKAKIIEHVEVTLKDGNTIDVVPHLPNIDFKGFAELINGILKKAEQGKEFVNTSQITPLSEMDENIKQNYIKLVANYAYSNNDVIEVEEYTEIISLIVRIEISSSSRLELRSYMSSVEYMNPTDTLLGELKEEVEEGSYDILGKSLFKDILYIYGQRNDILDWKDNSYLLELSNSLSVTKEEADLIIAAIKNDEDILKHRKNDTQIAKSIKDIAAKAAGVGIPMAAIYFSGSVAGLSAAGITSGLAAMGFGGLLGFSSMFTGIGTLIVVGLGTYHGIKKVSGIGDIQNNKQREYMLQAIIRNTQRSLSYLIEDINGITQQLMLEMQKGNENSQKIQKLSQMLNMLSQGAQLNTVKQQESEIEKVITKLPAKLDADRLMGLTNKPTLEKVREFIFSCYAEIVIAENEGGNSLDKIEYRLWEGLTLEEVENLHNLFEEIEYNKVAQAVFASAATKAKNLFGDKK